MMGRSERKACHIIRKPIEKIIVRYDGIPKNYKDVFLPVKEQLFSRIKKPSEIHFSFLKTEFG